MKSFASTALQEDNKLVGFLNRSILIRFTSYTSGAGDSFGLTKDKLLQSNNT